MLQPKPLGFDELTADRRLTHYLFRYPAKFHPPVVRALLERYTSEGDVVLDPFCGSGTLLVEAATMARNSIGVDIDPLAVAVTNAKVDRLDATALAHTASAFLDRLAVYRRADTEYDRRQFQDLTDREYADETHGIEQFIPAIPNLHHWFRRYVIVDLARIRSELQQLRRPKHKAFLGVVFASIIRNASNADPVPVSGLEVTKWMLQREAAGRIVNPFALLERSIGKAVAAIGEFNEAACAGTSTRAVLGDATELAIRDKVSAVITSPPYHGAVDYYRRHQLEMFWLGLTATQDDRLSLLRKYIGRPHVPPRHDWVREPLPTALAKEWEDRIREVSAERANAFRHYITAMTKVFARLAHVLPVGRPAVFVVGHSAWNATEIPTSALFDEISGDAFELEEVLSYDVKNRYMSYERHNKASIAKEFVLVLKRTSANPS